MSEPEFAPKPTYYLRSRGEVTGPHEIPELQAFVKSGRLTPSHEVSPDGVQWIHAGQFWEVFQPPEKPKLLRARRRSRSGKVPKVAPSSVAAPPSGVSQPTDTAPAPATEIPARVPVRVRSPFDVDAANVMTWSLIAAGLLALGVVTSVQHVMQALAMYDRLDGTLESVRKIALENQAGNSGAVEVLHAILGLGLFATFLAWQFMTSRNLAALCEGRMEFTPWAGIGWYFIPIGNLWKPYQVLREIIRRSEETAARMLLLFPSRQVLAVWWSVLVLRVPLRCLCLVQEGRIIRAFEATAKETRLQADMPNVSDVPELVRSWLWWDGVDGLLTLLASLLSIWIVVAVGYLQCGAFRARATQAG